MSAAAPRPRLILVAAVAEDRVIGDGRGMPWHLPEDLKQFRALTMGSPVLMGRRTWDSLPARFRPLPGRRNLVLTRRRDWSAPGAEAVGSVADAVALGPPGGRLFVIGGGELYAAALPLADELRLTEIAARFAGEVRFPDFADAGFVELSRERHRAAPPNDFEFSFVTYQRPN